MIRLILSILVLPAGAAADAERAVVLDDFAYPSVQAVRAAWKPIDKTTPQVELEKAAGQAALKLPCNFKANKEWRVAWDRKGAWDLSEARRIELSVVAPGRGARMILHLRSGPGWYGCTFSVPAGEGLKTLTPKRFGTEGTPGGWGRIEGVRISVLRGLPADRRVLLKRLRAICRPARVLVYRNDAGVRREPGLGACTRRTADALDRLGIDFEIAGDRGVAAGRLAGKKVAILPLNPVLPAPAGQAIRKFVAAGGKLLVCYQLPDPLGEILGVRLGRHTESRDGRFDAIRFQGRDDRPKITAGQQSWISQKIIPAAGTKVVGTWVDQAGTVSKRPAVAKGKNGYFVAHVLTRHDPPAKDRLLLEMLGELWYGAWKTACAHRRARLGRVGGFAGPAELTRALAGALQRRDDRARKIKALLARADLAARDAASVMKYGDAIVASETLAEAHDAYLRAYVTSARPKAGEFRAVWCHDPAGVRGWSWDRAIKHLADAGFNAIIPNMCWGDGAAYPSRLLPAVPLVAEKGDQLAQCLAAAGKHRVGVHVWKVNWRFWGGAPRAFRQRMRQAGRVQLDPAGKPLDWLCPSDPDNRKLEIDSMVEIVRRYPVQGIHFDYIRYPGQQGCYCPRCRRRFEAACGAKVKDWPADVRRGPLREKYLQFRRDNITAVVAAVAEQARKVRPGVLISAAVFHDWPSARDEVGQDWRLWIEKGYLDFVCPMQYTPDAAVFDDWTAQAVEWVGGKIPLMPGIGATLGQSPDVTVRQVLMARRHNTAGFVLFNYSSLLAREHLPALRLGATAAPATWTPPKRD